MYFYRLQRKLKFRKVVARNEIENTDLVALVRNVLLFRNLVVSGLRKNNIIGFFSF